MMETKRQTDPRLDAEIKKDPQAVEKTIKSIEEAFGPLLKERIQQVKDQLVEWTGDKAAIDRFFANNNLSRLEALSIMARVGSHTFPDAKTSPEIRSHVDRIAQANGVTAEGIKQGLVKFESGFQGFAREFMKQFQDMIEGSSPLRKSFPGASRPIAEAAVPTDVPGVSAPAGAPVVTLKLPAA
jgi:hypothetical protein